MHRSIVAILVLGAGLSACTSVRVKPVDPAEQVLHVCIEQNPKVTIGDFLPILQDGFDRHAISTEVFQADRRPARCEYVLTYTALRSWDITTYLSYADLWLAKDGRRIASAHYHLRGKGGLALTKWASVKSKMDPVIDELLGAKSASKSAANRNGATYVPAVSAASATERTVADEGAASRLRELQRLKDQGLITDEEFAEKRSAVLSEI